MWEGSSSHAWPEKEELSNHVVSKARNDLKLGIEDEVITAFGQHLMASNPDMPAQPPDMPQLTKCSVCGRVYKMSVTIPAATAVDGSTTRWCRRCVDTWDVDCSGGSSSLNFLLGLIT